MSIRNVVAGAFGLVFCILCTTSDLFAAPHVKIIESGRERLIVEYIPGLIDIKTIASPSGEAFLSPEFSNAELYPGKAGSPSFLGSREIISIPNLNGAKIEKIEYLGAMIEKAGRLAPSPTTAWGEDGSPTLIYRADETLYAAAPREFATLSDFGMLRECAITHLELAAVRQSPEGFVQFPEKIRVTIHFDKNGKARVATSGNNLFLNSNVAWRAPSVSDLALEGDEKLGDISSGSWFRIEIAEEGAYKLDAAYLSSKGINIPADKIETIKIFGEGGDILDEKVGAGVNNMLDEQEIIVNKNGSELGSIVFYGAPASGFKKIEGKIAHYSNAYSKSNYYLLTWGGRPGKRAIPVEPPQAEAVNFPTSYLHRIFFEEELVNPFDWGGGRTYFGKSSFDAPFIDVLHNLDRSRDIFFRIALANKSDGGGLFTATENQNFLGKVSVSGVNASNHSFASRGFLETNYPAAKIGSDSRSVISVKYTPSSTKTLATPYLDYYEIHYPRSFHAIDGELSFSPDLNLTGVTEFNVSGFSGQTLGWDATNRRSPKLLTNTASTGGMIIFKQDLSPSTLYSFYATSKFKAPASIQSIEFAGLRYEKSNADMILFTPKEFLNSANEYAEYRAKSSGIKVKVVTTEQLYNEFASCIPDPTAIRDYVAQAYASWDVKPNYVLLWGDGHFDIKYVRTKKPIYIPTWQYEASPFDTFFTESEDYYPTDDYFGCVRGDDWLIDVAVGRFNIESEDEGQKILEKVRNYETASSKDAWRNTALMVADDGWNQGEHDGGEWTSQTETVANSFLAPGMQAKKLYLIEYPSSPGSAGRTKPRANEDILSAINTAGASVVNYIGHGNPRIWAAENVLRRDEDIPRMINKDKLFLAFAGTCEYGRFDNPDVRCGAEEMVLNPNGGAIAVYSATRIVFGPDNFVFNKYFFSKLFQRNANGFYPTFGEAIRNTKAMQNGHNDRTFYLAGDPSMKLPAPEYIVKIDSINGVAADSVDFVELKGLTKVTVVARVLNPKDSSLSDNFNGMITLNTLDGDVNYVRNEDPPTGADDFKYAKYGPTLARATGKVEGGRATVDFLLPKDINFSEKTGRMFAYAVANDDRFAAGESQKFKVTGIDFSSFKDEKGPDIDIYIDSRKFNPGDVVQSSPMLIVDIADESGINTTGLGIGHSIEAWLDDATQSINLNSKFESSIEDGRRGTAKVNLSKLTPGEHIIKIRAWDIFNNYSVQQTKFVVSAVDLGFSISKSENYPNPFERDGTTIAFKHNLPAPFDVEVKIFNSIGATVRTLRETATTSLYTEIKWDGKDGNGSALPPGAYFIQIVANGEAISGHMAILEGK